VREEFGERGGWITRLMLTCEYRTCQDKVRVKLEVIGGAGVRGGESQNPQSAIPVPKSKVIKVIDAPLFSIRRHRLLYLGDTFFILRSCLFKHVK
jgi:hypothetical protein